MGISPRISERPNQLPFVQSVSLVRWTGSKNSIAPILLNYIPTCYRTYCEPFAGSASLFFALRPRTGIIADINEDLILFYRELKSHPRKLHSILSSFKLDEETYYGLRSIHPENLDSVTRAARFIYLNRLCFNGVYRTNKKGKFNVPMGKRTGRMPDLRSFLTYSDRLSRCQIHHSPYQITISNLRLGDFVYLDPPYQHKPRRSKGEFTYESFDTAALPELIETAQRLTKMKVNVMLSYIETPVLRKALKGWRFVRIDLPPRISRSPSYNVTQELLATNY
ncbi:MAG: Dam family site-specific DNA-(adenine-N6)-methyltransferase [Flavobacteriales bacterium]|nr:Dam family site-specific DNA-(adenine-N6)-methyltransferase [Flavobacteriales bacterium]